jgi:hypothetical protein
MTTFEFAVPLIFGAIAVVGTVLIRRSAHRLEEKGVKVRTDRD